MKKKLTYIKPGIRYTLSVEEDELICATSQIGFRDEEDVVDEFDTKAERTWEDEEWDNNTEMTDIWEEEW